MAELICRRTDLEEEKFTDFTNFELDVENDNKHGDWSTLRNFDAGYNQLGASTEKNILFLVIHFKISFSTYYYYQPDKM